MARGKIQIKRIQNTTKKANELTVLYDAKVSIIMFSSTGKLHKIEQSYVFFILYLIQQTLPTYLLSYVFFFFQEQSSSSINTRWLWELIFGTLITRFSLFFSSDLLLPAALEVVIDNIFYFNWLICPPEYARELEETERGE